MKNRKTVGYLSLGFLNSRFAILYSLFFIPYFPATILPSTAVVMVLSGSAAMVASVAFR